MSGPLEEPFFSGSARSFGSDLVMDKLPVTKATTGFTWDVNSGRFNFENMCADLKFGGKVVGNGTLAFDMSK